ncbi:MAG TPA: 3'-5' exonuclease [Candidatus Saccharimonadales bacterium]|nr:3'-5' exonuclease [Candidatus Saccharimonadales bacterium]
MSLLKGPFVFVDIETNGLSPVWGRVIEVAAIRVEAGEIVGSVNTLVDSGTELPQFITNLTGITSSQVHAAPTFAQVAEELYDLIDGSVFVAHNVRFDYSFLKQEFRRTGKDFLPRQLCTVKLSRALYPEHRGHKLQDLIDRHGFAYQSRHRAYDDAYILWQFMQLVQQQFPSDVVEQVVSKQISKPVLPSGH